jgi:hypothetical protein
MTEIYLVLLYAAERANESLRASGPARLIVAAVIGWTAWPEIRRFIRDTFDPWEIG